VALTRRQIAFVEHYLQCRNATEAARRAGYSLRSARELAHRNMENAEVLAEIAARFAETTQLATDEVLQRLAAQARGDIGVFFEVVEFWTIEEPLPTYEIVRTRIDLDETGNQVPHYLLRRIQLNTAKLTDPAYSPLVKKFSDSPKNGLSVELYDAQAALQIVGKHLGMFKEQAPDVNVSVNFDLDDWKRQREGRRAALDAVDADGDDECAPRDE
jgi:phage terminase small subunit